jgi:mRNA-degrading endonuclease RelE of RelBE toxin-antitoxin system
MHQIVFNEISASEVSAIPTLEQLELISGFKVEQAFLDGEKDDPSFGVVERDGKKIYRYRSSDYRIYFTMEDGAVVVQRVLHADSLKDFFFRSGMGSDNEDRKLGKSRSFWKLIDDGEKAARK